jgi:uncharacterized membrane protein AbrB (regulator of aidB expression)
MPIRKRTILQEIKYFSLFNLGVSDAQDKALQNRVRLINMIGIGLLLILCPFTVFSIYKDYPHIIFTNTLAILGTTLALYLNSREYYTVAKSALITICSLTILVYFLWQ